MKNYLFILRCLPAFLFCCPPVLAQLREEGTPAGFKLLGPVRSVEKYGYFASLNDSGFIEKGRDYQGEVLHGNYRLVFDKQGRILERGRRFLNTDTWTTYTYTYNEKGYRATEHSGGSLLRVYTYDSSGKLSEVRWPESEYRRSRADTRDSSLYDAKGRLKAQWRYSDNGNGKMTRYGHTWQYDASGRILEVQAWNNTHKAETARYSYAPGGIVQIRTQYPDDPKQPEYTLSKLDGQGNELLQEAKYRIGHSAAEKTETEFNERNEPVRIKITRSGTEKIREMTYIYDERGNWTRMTVYLNGKPESIHVRTITYYP